MDEHGQKKSLGFFSDNKLILLAKCVIYNSKFRFPQGAIINDERKYESVFKK